MQFFVTIGNDWKLLIIDTKSFVLDVYGLLQSLTKIVRLAPPAPLFNVGWKFACSASSALQSFSKLEAGRTGEFWVSLSKSNIVLGVFHEIKVSLNNFCDWL